MAIWQYIQTAIHRYLVLSSHHHRRHRLNFILLSCHSHFDYKLCSCPPLSFSRTFVEPVRTCVLMKQDITERWVKWLEDAGKENELTLTFVKENLCPELRNDGFAVPSRRSEKDALEKGLEPLSTNPTTGLVISFAHVLNLVWTPVIEYFDSCTPEKAPEWTKSLGVNQTALLSEMVGTIDGADEAMDMDKWIEYIGKTLLRFVKVHVPQRLILQVMSPIVPFHVPPTPANALHMLRSAWCCKLVGPGLAAQINRLILAEIADVPVPLISEPNLSLQVRQDLITCLEHEHCGTELDDHAAEQTAPKKARKDQESIAETMKNKTAQVLFMIENKVAASRVHATVTAAGELLQTLASTSSSSSGSSEPFQGADELVQKTTLARHLLLLDGALDRCASDKLLSLRESGGFAGVAVVTDESPPSQPRFRGLRFQISVFYWGTYLDLAKWNSCEDPPIIRSTCLADIMHCPGKKGVDVSRVIEKQLARLGLNCFDVTAGTGDGGGENEGQSGVHAYFENLNPGYVRRRCIPHIAWRTCDLAIRSSGLDYRALAAYFVEGITWSRLRELATREPADGGLGLFRDGSRRCKDMFGQSPCAIIDSRPETDLNLLKFLEGKEHLLHRLATKDLEQRSLNAETKAAIMNLGDITKRIHRRILQEILVRCMFLLYYSGHHPTVAAATTWDELMEKAVTIILNLEITDKVLERFNLTEDNLRDMDERPKTWVDLAVLQVLGEEALVAERLPEALAFHRSVSNSAAAHLNLLATNTYRTPWLAAKILSKDKFLARDSACALVRHLATTRPNNRTPFEQHLFNSEELYLSLENFSKADPPVLVWHDQGRYETLFKFLAPRFLLAPDHVLDAERIHSRWQWSCSQKHAQKLQTLNASLRMMHRVEHNQVMPIHEELLENLRIESLEHKLAYDGLDAEVTTGWRHLQAQRASSK